MKNIKTSLIITTYNRPDALKFVLMSVLNQTEFPDEVIIADDGSKSETADLIKNFAEVFPVPLQHVWHEDNGFRLSEIRNKAIALAVGDYIIQIDGDIILEKHFIADHMHFARPYRFVQGRRAALMKDGTMAQFVAGNLNGFSPLMKDLILRENAIRFPLLSRIYSPLKKKNRLIGANEAFWREDVIAVNGYDNGMVGWGAEDEHFCRRLINIGVLPFNVYFACTCFHLWHDFSKYPLDWEKINKKKALIKEIVENKITWCENGIDKYL